MSINSINVKLPQLETVPIKRLHQGDVFMLPNRNNAYQPVYNVYMLLPVKPFEVNRQCVCLLDGSIKTYHESTKVIRLKVTIECSYCSADDDDGLPF